MAKKSKTIKKRNEFALALQNKIFAGKVVPAKKGKTVYKRKAKHENKTIEN